MRYAMIMAGGAGTRLWPMSRKNKPKQLLRFIQRDGVGAGAGSGGEKQPRALLELADKRLDGLIDQRRRYVCTAEQYRDAVAELLNKYDDEHILGEPAARDTVNAVGFAAAILAKEDEDATFAVLTADHVIEPIDTFQERMDLGFRLVEQDSSRFVTFSIKPTYPATGFGYVEQGSPIRDAKDGKKLAIDGAKDKAYYVQRFVEKPDRARAEVYVESGDYAWNSGMFVWRAQTFLDALARYKPESYEGLMQIQKAWGGKKFKSVLNEVYPTLPKISVDFAILEPAAKDAFKAAASAGKSGGSKKPDSHFSVCTVQMDITWLDVGSWPSYAETVKADKAGNRCAGEGASVLVDCKNTLSIAGKGHTVSVLGMDDVIVIHTPDATLVMPKSKSEELKKLHGVLEEGLK